MKTTLFALTLIGASAAHASSCGDIAAGLYNLTNDLTCNGNAITVAASNTTINLNGHTISCAGSGVGGSCQPSLNPVGGNQAIGISSKGYSHVTVNGKGVVSGFYIGIALENGVALTVDNVTVTGPATPKIAGNNRDVAFGIYMNDSNCTLSSLAPGPVSQLLNNVVDNQSVGIDVRLSSCVNIIGNYVHHNVSRAGGGIGVFLNKSSHITMYSNQVLYNGANIGLDSGVMLIGTTAMQNYLYGNTVSNNCGSGIEAKDGANNNVFIANQARNNGLYSTEGICAVPAKNVYFDLAEVNEGPGNNWNPNNLCHTQSPGIPAGVCNPGE